MHELRKIPHTPEINEMHLFCAAYKSWQHSNLRGENPRKRDEYLVSGDPEPVGPWSRWGGGFGPRSRTSGSDAKNGSVAK